MTSITVRRLAAAMLGVTLVAPMAPLAGAAEAADPALVQQVTREVLRELREGGALDDAVRQGIEDYVKAQREMRARAERERAQATAARARAVRRVSADRDHVFGNPEAEISLIEYSDFECPFCKRFHPTARALVERFAGKVNWVYRHFPLSFHNPGAQKQAEASECAAAQGGNTAFWRYADAIYLRTRSNGKGFPLDRLTPLAIEIGLDGEQFRACLDSDRMGARVREDFAEGSRAGITGTPGNVLLNNRTGDTRLRAGAVPVDALAADVEALLAK